MRVPLRLPSLPLRLPPSLLPLLRGMGTQPRLVTAAYVALAVFVSAPAWIVKHPPMMDLPFHLATIRIIHSLHDPAFGLDSHFVLTLGRTQYVLYYLLGSLLAYPLDVVKANVLLMSGYLGGTLLALRELLSALGRDERLSLFSVPLLVNAMFMFGLFPFLVGIPLMFLALAASVRYFEAPTRGRGILLCLLALALFYSHIFPFALFGLGFAAAVQGSGGGQRAPELADWKRAAGQSVGALTVPTYENPASVRVLDRLLSHEGPERMRVFQEERGREVECTFTRGVAQAGSLGFGPTIPANKFTCPGGGFVGVSVIATLDYTPRRCFYAPVMSGSAGIRIRFQDVAIGRTLHGHHALYVEAERGKSGAPVTIAFSFDQGPLGRFVHQDGEGWKAFDVSTEAFAGQKKELIADISSTDGNRRMYCFEADTR